jgi:phosphoglycerate dehydrogenase-like enzyme
MDSFNVVVIAPPGAPYLAALEKLPPSAKLHFGNTVEALDPIIPEADVLFNANFKNEPLRTVFPKAKKLRWLHQASAGVDTILSPEIIASPVPLTNGRGVFRESLAEFAIAAMLFFAKDLRRMVHSQEAGKWDPFDVTMLSRHTLGIVGYGEMGQATARLAHAFGMKVIAVRRRATLSSDDPHLDAVYAPDRLHELLAASDYVLVAAPSTPQTRGMIGPAEFNVMKPTAVIMNLGRGPVIQEPALIEALQSGRIKGAALDVFDVEPVPAGHPFYSMPNVLFSAHAADHTVDWKEMSVERFAENYNRFERGEPLMSIVDKHAGY